MFPQFSRYNSTQCADATRLYEKIAQNHGLTLTQMALAFVTQQAFVSSNIIGATTMEQLRENIASIDVFLSDEIIKEINQVQSIIPDPAP